MGDTIWPKSKRGTLRPKNMNHVENRHNGAPHYCASVMRGFSISRTGRIAMDRLKNARHQLTLPDNLAISNWPPVIGEFAEEALWIVHLLFGRRFYGPRRADPDRWIPIHQKTLRKVVDPRRAKAWLLFLEESQIIECSGCGYRQGVQSMTYRMNARFRSQKPVIKDVRSDKLNHKIDEFRKELAWWSDDPLYVYLERQLDRITINKPAALGYVRFEKDYNDPDIKSPEYARREDESRIEMLASRSRFFTVDDYGRVHSNLTNLSSDLRQFLKLKTKSKKPIAFTDIRNSQPFIFGVLLNQLHQFDPVDFSEQHQNLARLILGYLEEQEEDDVHIRTERREAPGRPAAPPQASHRTPPPHPPPPYDVHFPMYTSSKKDTSHLIDNDYDDEYCTSLSLSSKATNGLSVTTYENRPVLIRDQVCSDVSIAVRLVYEHWSECRRYIDLCCSGQFYEFLFKRLRPDSEFRKLPRQRLKQEIFRQTIFAKNGMPPDYELRDIFVSEFPGLWRIIRRIKRTHHSLLPKLLQHYESEFVIRNAAASFMKRHPGRFLATVHDSLMIEVDLKDEAVKAIMEAFNGVGLFPTVAPGLCVEHHS